MMSSPRSEESPVRLARSRREIIQRLLNLLPKALYLLWIGYGTWLAVFHIIDDGARTVLLLKPSGGWQMNAFAAFGTMSGFALAALALVATLSTNARAQDLLE